MRRIYFTVVFMLLLVLALAAYALWGVFHHGSADEDKAYAMLFDSAGESDIALLKEILPRIKTSWWREYALSRMYAADGSVSFGDAVKSLKNSEFVAYLYAAKSLKNPELTPGGLNLSVRDLFCVDFLKKIWSGAEIRDSDINGFALNLFPGGDKLRKSSYGNLFLREIIKTRRFDLIPVFNSAFNYDVLNLSLSLCRLGAKAEDFRDVGKNYAHLVSLLYSSAGAMSGEMKSSLKKRIYKDFEFIKNGSYLWRKALLAQALYNIGEKSAAIAVFDDFYASVMKLPLVNYYNRQEVRNMAIKFALQNGLDRMATRYIASAPSKEFRMKMLADYSFIMSQYLGIDKTFEIINTFSK